MKKFLPLPIPTPLTLPHPLHLLFLYLVYEYQAGGKVIFPNGMMSKRKKGKASLLLPS